MPFEDTSLDAAFAIEATCHSSALEKPYAEIFRVLKPGGKFAAYEWLTTPEYDENNLEHKKIIHDLEVCFPTVHGRKETRCRSYTLFQCV